MTADSSPILPGRLGSPDMSLERRSAGRPADDRGDGADRPGRASAEPHRSTADSPIEALLEYVGAAEEGFEALFGVLGTQLPPVDGCDDAASR